MKADCPSCKRKSPRCFRSRDYNEKATAATFDHFRCPGCGVVFISPVPRNLGDYYTRTYYEVPTTLEELAGRADYDDGYKLELLTPFASQGRLLDVGANCGDFCYLARNAGFDVTAIEMDARCRRFLSTELRVTTIDDDDTAEAIMHSGPCDVITMWQVIEHLTEPWAALKAAAASLSPGGLLVVSTPNPKALQALLFRQFWVHLDAPRHLQLIPEELLTQRLTSLGFTRLLLSTTDPFALRCNASGWNDSPQHLASHAFARRLAKPLAQLQGLLGYVERHSRRSSIYTAIYRKNNGGRAAWHSV